MPLDRFSPDDPREWLNRAHSNLVRAQTELPGVYLEDLCFDAQQAAEKALKALLLELGIRFPLTHDLNKLLELILQAGVAIPDRIREAVVLSDYAVSTRYPGVAESPTRLEYLEAVRMANDVVSWVEEILSKDD